MGTGESAPGMVGRQEERDLVTSLLRAGRSVVLAGSAGVGKTRLAQEVVAEAPAAGLATTWISATQSSRDIPFAALSPLLLADSTAADEAMTPAWVLRTLGRAPGSGTPALPDVVVVDDAHLLDDASATSILQLITAHRATVLLTLTIRAVAPDAVTAMWKDGAAERVELLPLSRRETDALVAEVLGGPCDALTLERIWQTASGNPLYVREVVDAASAGGRLVLRRGRWQLEAGNELTGALVELVTARIDRLDPRVRRVLEVVALAAPVPLRVLEQVVELDAVAEAEERGLVEVVADRDRAVARATHPMHAEAARSMLPGARQRMLCRSLADAIEATGLRRHEDLLRFLDWRLTAGDGAPVDLLVRGAWRATEALDMRLAERFGRAAVAIAPDHHAARLALADAIYRQARHADALEVLAASDAVDDRARTEVVVARAKSLWGLGRLVEAESILLDAASGITDRGCLGWLQAFRATVRAALGYPAESIALARPIADDPSYGARTTLSSLSSLALALAFSGRSADAAAAVARGRDPELLAAAESRTLLSWMEPALWAAAWLSGDLAAAETLAEAYRRSGLETRDPERVAGGSMGVGWAALMRGEIAGAVSRLEDAVALTPPDDRIGIKTIALVGLGWAHAWNGDERAAVAALDEAEAAAASGARWFDPCVTIGRAWVAAAAGDDRGARDLFERSADESARRGLLPYALFALHGLARLDRAGAVTVRIAALARGADGPLAPALAAHAQALAADDPGALEACGARFDELGMWMLAAECAAAAARAHEARGAASSAEAARARCDDMLRRCEGACPATVERLRTSSPLTARERQIARLAAGGRTTREIADQLNVSARTVDSHLAHVYAKLGVDGRHELAAAIGAPAI